MGLLIAVLLALPLVNSHYNSFTKAEREINLSTESKLIDVQNVTRDVFKKRSVPRGTPLCGRTKVNTLPINRGEDISNKEGDHSYDDNDYDDHVDKIFGGTYVTYGEIPWQAAIRHDGRYICSAVIISEFWVATAAHCLENLPKDWRFVVIQVGDHRLNVPETYDGNYGIQSTYIPTDYKASTFDWDIALIKIKPRSDGRGIRFTSYIQPICLPTNDDSPYDNQQLKVSGWGVTTFGSWVSAILKRATVNVRIPSICQSWFRMGFTDRMLCAESRLSGVCTGDDGGPATAKHKGFAVLMGLVVAGSTCGRYIGGSVYVNVYNVRSWINTIISSNSKGLEAVMPVRPIISE